EMARLQDMIRPTIGVLTNIGTAHSEGFKSNVEKLSEKLFLFKGAEKLILSPKYISVGTTLPENTEVISWGDEEGCDLQIKEINKGTYTQITAIYKGETVDIQITLSDDASIENA